MEQRQIPSHRSRYLKRQARNLVLAVLYVFFGALGFLGRLSAERGKGLAKDEVKKMLLIRLDLLGDVVLTMPAVAALRRRYPQAHIAMLVLPYTAPMVALFPYVDEILSFDINKLRPSGEMLNIIHYTNLWRLLGRLRAERYDLCIGFYGPWASLFSYLSGAPLRIGYQGEGYPFMYNRPLSGRRYRKRQHEVEYNLALAEAAGASREWRPLEIQVPLEAREKVAHLLAQEGVGPEDLLIALHPGAINGSAKQWPPSGWGALADLLAEGMGAKAIITGVASELPLAQEVARQARSKPIVLAGKTSVPELVALLCRCRLVVCADSAPLHIAGALGIPVAALHGPTDPALSGPYREPALVVHKEDLCQPCYNLRDNAECARGTPICMTSITPQEVYAVVEGLLETSAPQRERVARP